MSYKGHNDNFMRLGKKHVRWTLTNWGYLSKRPTVAIGLA